MDGLRVLLPLPEFDDAVRGFCDKVFSAIAATNRGARLIVEKTPGHYRYHAVIKRLYPDARFLQLVRDPRAVVASLLAASKTSWGKWAPKNAKSAALVWRDAMEICHRQLPRYGEDAMAVRYEDLLAEPEKTLAPIWQWLGLEPIPFDPARFSLAALVEGSGTGPPLKPTWENRIGFFRRGEAEAWRTELSQNQITIVEGICAGLMEDCGYHPSFIGRIAPPAAR
jgi:hypothetical protein